MEPLPRKIWYSLSDKEKIIELKARCEEMGYVMEEPKPFQGGFEIRGVLSDQERVRRILSEKSKEL